MPPIDIRAFGSRGVNIDVNPLLLENEELRDSQNAFHDPSDAHGGGIRTRRGFTAFTASPLAGPLLGGIGMAVKGVARATGSGGGPGTGGTGPGDGGPPGSTGPSGSGPLPTGGMPTGGSPPFGGARIIVVGRSSGVSSTRYGTSWFVTSENMNDAAIINTGPPGPPNVWGQNPDFGPDDIQAPRAGVVFDNSLYYFGGITNISGNQRATIRRTDGKVDELVVTVPRDARTTGTNSQLVSFFENGDFIWITESSNSAASGAATAYSRLLRLDPTSNTLVDCKITGSSGAAGYVFGPMAEYNGRMFVGEYTNTVSGTATVLPVLPTSTGAVIDGGIGALTFGGAHRNVTCLCKYDSNLYIGTGLKTSGAFAQIYQTSITATGVWTGASVLAGSGGTGATNNRFVSMIEFKSNLYASYFNPTTATAQSLIYKFDGTSWSTAFTSSGSAQRVPFHLWVDKDTMYAISATDVSTGAHRFLTTADGTTWTDKTTTVAAVSGAIASFSLLFGYDQ